MESVVPFDESFSKFFV